MSRIDEIMSGRWGGPILIAVTITWVIAILLVLGTIVFKTA